MGEEKEIINEGTQYWTNEWMDAKTQMEAGDGEKKQHLDPVGR